MKLEYRVVPSLQTMTIQFKALHYKIVGWLGRSTEKTFGGRFHPFCPPTWHDSVIFDGHTTHKPDKCFIMHGSVP
eukprot:gene27056-biopygen6403